MRRPFAQVDVFSATQYLGNPVAVVLHADGLASDQMARFANWTNLSETTFVLPPTTPDGASTRWVARMGRSGWAGQLFP